MTSKAPLPIDPRLGDAICDAIRDMTKVEDIHIILVAFDATDDALGAPAFVTSLHPDEMHTVFLKVANYLEHADLSKRRVVEQEDISGE